MVKEMDLNIHARFIPPVKPTTFKGYVKQLIEVIFGGRKVVQLVGKVGVDEVFAKNMSRGKVVKTEKEYEKMMKDRKYIPIPLKEIINRPNAELPKINEIVFVKVDSLAKLGLSKYKIKEIQTIQHGAKIEKSKGMKVVHTIKRGIEAPLSKIVFFEQIKHSLVKKWSQPVNAETLKEADALVKEKPQIRLTADRQKALLKARTEGSNTFLEDPQKLQGWLNAEEFIRNKAEKNESLTLQDICKINQLMTGEEGKIRDHPVYVGGWGGASYVSENDVGPMMDALIKNINRGVEKGVNPIVLAAKSYQKMVSIHPFTDGNGRTCRLVMDYILLRAGLPPAALGPNVNVALFGDQSCEHPPPPKDPTIAVDLVIAGVKASYHIIEQRNNG